MKNYANLKEIDCKKWQLVIKTSSFTIMLDQQKLIGPEQNKKVQTTNWIKDRHAARISQNSPE